MRVTGTARTSSNVPSARQPREMRAVEVAEPRALHYSVEAVELVCSEEGPVVEFGRTLEAAGVRGLAAI